jgi:hypothetical protein
MIIIRSETFKVINIEICHAEGVRCMDENVKEMAGSSQPESKPSLEEGMYYERVFGPEKVRVMFDEKTKELAKIVFEDKNGQSLEIVDPRLVSRVLMYYAKYTEFKNVAELRKLAPDVLQQALNIAIGKRNRDLKAMYDDQGRLQGIASTMHAQVSWAKVREVVESAIREVAGDVSKPENGELPFKWTYGLPLKNENVSGWVGVHGGNNIIKGHSAIKVFSRWRTERFDEKGGVRRPACLNWCGMWQFPEQFFNVSMKRLNNIVKMIGQEEVKNVAMLQFHIKPDMEAFKQELKTGVANMMKTMEKIQPIIDRSIHSPLSETEMENILLAYQTKGRSYIPDYIVEQVMAHVEDETVWGFSQAVSWVRTHGDFKFVTSTNAMFKPVEERDLTWRLENIAGEVLSLTPTINDIHKKHGEITLEFLVGEEQAKAIREAQKEKLEKQTAKAVIVCSKPHWVNGQQIESI